VSGLAFVWTALFIMGASEALDSQSTVIIFLLFLSYYWVQQVLQNIMHVTTAGVVGTWYVQPKTHYVPYPLKTCRFVSSYIGGGLLLKRHHFVAEPCSIA
jgi:Plasma-membrane choline transporter